MSRRLLFRLALAAALALGLAACDRLPEGGLLADGAVDPTYLAARQLDYLVYATEQVQTGSVLNAIDHMERERVDPSYTAPVGAWPADAWDATFAKIADLHDTSDFDVLYLLNAYLGYAGHPALAPELWQKIEDAILGFKFWYTQPTPPGLTDDMWYWSENHQIIFHTIEYLAGQTWPDETFRTTGMTGAQHMAHARPRILKWLDHRARLGFDEWHSDVYYAFDLTPLLTLAEYAQDEEIASKASMLLDVLFFDLALHDFRGAFGATHGRSYKKDKNSALDEDTWDLTKMLFDNSDYPYQSWGDARAALFARAQKYRLPAVILDVAGSEVPFADRERMGIAFDEFWPVFTDYPTPYGFSLAVPTTPGEEPEDLGVWWSMSALTTWQVLPLVWYAGDTWNLWETELFLPFNDIKQAVGSLQFAQVTAFELAHAASAGLLKEVNTYTWRTPDYMLSSAQDYRKGSRGWQYHAWQATFDANAQVFTTHPGHPPRENTTWQDDGEPGDWTGTASMPRSAQYENVAIHLYAPQYEVMVNEPFYSLTRYEPYTHAYFPQDHFDEVIRDGHWTFGRLRDGYIALYSWRTAEFVDHGPSVPSNGMTLPWDLRADGGPDNVWIVECGRRADWVAVDAGDPFGAFREAIGSAAVDVVPVTEGLPSRARPPFFQVSYDSPSQGPISFGWETPFVVAGHEVPLHDYPRYDNPWAHMGFPATKNTAVHDSGTGDGFAHDFDAAQRWVYRVVE
jgi:hypothetical protein